MKFFFFLKILLSCFIWYFLLKVDGYGIDSVAQFFLDFGYSPRDKLKFPKKKLEAIWFSPPNHLQGTNGSGINGPLPRIFISELLVDEMSHQAQVFKYVMVDLFFFVTLQKCTYIWSSYASCAILNFLLFMFFLYYKASKLSQNLDELVTLKKCQCWQGGTKCRKQSMHYIFKMRGWTLLCTT